MNAVVKIKLGNKVLEIGGEGKQTDIIKNLAFWSALPTKCTLCKGEDISLSFRSPKGNDYYGLRCSCGAEFTFHQFKTGGFYISQEDTWKKWSGEKTEKQEKAPEGFIPPTSEDVPF